MKHINIPKVGAFAHKCHKGQFRWDGITPYISHPLLVASKFTDPTYQAVALLHDVMEDCGRTKQDLFNEGLPQDVIDAVAILTKTKEMNYFDYIVSILDNKIAREVKIADIEHNMLTVVSDKKRAKYAIALFLLKGYNR